MSQQDLAQFSTPVALTDLAASVVASSPSRIAPASFAAPAYLPGDEPMAWYALVTRARNERKVFEQLQRKRLDAFLPTVVRWSRWRDRKKQIEWALFPCYCFVRVRSSQWLPVLSCAGVHHVVSFGDRPAVVADHEIDGIRTLLSTTLQYDPCPFVQEGMMVEVTYGPLTGVRGRLVRKGHDTRLILSIEMLGRALSVQVDAADVRPL